MRSIQLPPPLKPGDLLRAIAPSGALREQETFEKGIETWRSRGYQVELEGSYKAQWGYLAGEDTLRRQALAQVWHDSKCKAILCIRGGYGSARLLEDWSWEWGELQNGEFASSTSPSPLVPQSSKTMPHLKWLIGFSDITGLLWSLAKIGIGSVHGPVLTTLAAEPDWSIKRLFDCLEGRPLGPLKGQGWGGGKVEGILLPANLTVATHLLGTPIQPSLEGTILALEDVTEAPYRIDRLLTQWRMTGAFKGVRGIALGRFSRCEPPAGYPSWSVDQVLRDRLCDLNIPIVSELPFGHDGANAALPVGQIVQLDADEGSLSICAK